MADGAYTDGDTVTVTVPLTVGADDTNAYFVKVLSAATGGSIINYSDRFTLSGMTGVFPASVIAGLKTVSGTSGPATVNEIQQVQNDPAASDTAVGGAASFALPFTMQTVSQLLLLGATILTLYAGTDQICSDGQSRTDEDYGEEPLPPIPYERIPDLLDIWW